MAKCMEKAESHCKSYPRCDGCGAYREPTNADRIRSMSDEELAVKLNGGCPPTRIEGEMCYETKTCTKCWLGWLKQPAERGEDK